MGHRVWADVVHLFHHCMAHCHPTDPQGVQVPINALTVQVKSAEILLRLNQALIWRAPGAGLIGSGSVEKILPIPYESDQFARTCKTTIDSMTPAIMVV